LSDWLCFSSFKLIPILFEFNNFQFWLIVGAFVLLNLFQFCLNSRIFHFGWLVVSCSFKLIPILFKFKNFRFWVIDCVLFFETYSNFVWILEFSILSDWLCFLLLNLFQFCLNSRIFDFGWLSVLVIVLLNLFQFCLNSRIFDFGWLVVLVIVLLN
jgi:hypothetical protein